MPVVEMNARGSGRTAVIVKEISKWMVIGVCGGSRYTSFEYFGSFNFN